jgi:hypothetical protein
LRLRPLARTWASLSLAQHAPLRQAQPDALAALTMCHTRPATFSSAMEVAPSLGRCNEIRQLLARVEHARLHSRRGDPDDLRDLFDRFAVEVDEVDDLAVSGDSRAKDRRSTSARFFFCSTSSGSSAGSASLDASSSSSSASVRRRRAESAL